ncbi:hypothetical protein [Clostridium botulinum]|uniref:hypothetical protein n=1 Tax=Clostridium botulinum TaxID=1491 RepID=UPI000A46EBF7|nr:hypothetical protein [Clostridium botulinum]
MANELKRSKRIIIGDDNIQNEINTENLKLLKKYERDMQMRELSNKSIYSYKCDLMEKKKNNKRKSYGVHS